MNRLSGVILATTLAASCAAGQWVESTIRLRDNLVGADYIEAVIHDTAGSFVYVGGESIIVIDGVTDRKVARIPVSGWRLALNPVSRKLYAIGSESLHVINAQTNTVIRSLPSGYDYDAEPSLVHVPVGNKMYCIAPDLGGIGVIDGSTDSLLGAIALRNPLALVYNPRRNKLYCAQSGEDLTVIDCEQDTITKVLTLEHNYPGYRPICYDPDDDKVYCGSEGIYVIDCATDSVVRQVGHHFCWDLLYSATQRSVYCLSVSTIRRIDCASDSEVGMVWLPGGREGLALGYNPAVNKLYCACDPQLMFVVDCATDSILAETRVGYVEGRNRFCANTIQNKVYCAHPYEGRVSVIDGTTNQVTAVVPTIRHGPSRPLYVPARNRVYCLDYRAGNLLVIDGERNRLLATRFVGVYPRNLEYCGQGGKVYYKDGLVDGLTVVGGTSDTIIGRIQCPGLSWPMRYLPDVHKLYCRLGDSALAVIDVTADSVLRTVAVDHLISTLVADPVRSRIYATGSSSDTISVIDATLDSVVAKIVTGRATSSYGFSPTQNRLYCYSDRGNVTVVDCSTYQLAGLIVTPPGDNNVQWNPRRDKLYQAMGGTSFTVIDCPTNSVAAYMQVSEGAKYAAFDTIANRVYLPCDGRLYVADGTGDSVLTTLPVTGAGELVWNPTFRRVYVLSESAIAVIRDTAVGVREVSRRSTAGKARPPTVVRGLLFLPAPLNPRLSASALLDISGRKVMSLLPGTNDVRSLAPGIYFVRQPSAADGKPSAITKVIVTR